MDVFGYGVQSDLTVSVVLRFKLKHNTTKAGLTGLTHNSAGLIISTIVDGEATATPYTQAGGNIETIATLGTYGTPTAGKCRFKEVDATSHPGLYEFHFEDARFIISNGLGLSGGAQGLIIAVHGATNLEQYDACIPLTDHNPGDVITATVNQVSANIPSALGAQFGNYFPVRPTRATELEDFPFYMELEDGTPAEGLEEVIVSFCQDTSGFAAAENNVEEIERGWYAITATEDEMDGNNVILEAVAEGCKTTRLTILTEKKPSV